MKNRNSNQLSEFSYYELYLLSYLRESHPDKTDNLKFITERADEAADTFELSRREGKSIEAAQELAMATLIKGLHFSPYDTLIEVLWNEFADMLSPADAPDAALLLLPHCKEVLDKYDLTDDFAATPQYSELYTELTGFLTLKIESYGIQ